MSESYLSLSLWFDDGEVISALWQYDFNDEEGIAESMKNALCVSDRAQGQAHTSVLLL